MCIQILRKQHKWINKLKR